MYYSVSYSLILFFCVPLSHSCDTNCYSNCSALNADEACFLNCGCPPQKQAPRNPELTRNFVKSAVGIMKRHAPNCNRASINDCSIFEIKLDYEKCVEHYGCSALLNPEIWKAELPQELWAEVRPHILVSKFEEISCEEQCSKICEVSSEYSLCEQQCRDWICYESFKKYDMNLKSGYVLSDCIQNCDAICGPDRNCRSSCFRANCVIYDYENTVELKEATESLKDYDVNLKSGYRLSDCIQNCDVICGPDINCRSSCFRARCVIYDYENTLELKEVIEKYGLERDTSDENLGDPNATKPQPGQPSTADDRTPYEIELKLNDEPDIEPYKGKESQSTMKILVFHMLAPACLVLMGWIVYGMMKRPRSVKRYRFDDIYSETPYTNLGVKV
jgi:hypothetical protein